MTYIKFVVAVVGLCMISGCTKNDCQPEQHDTGRALQGTETVVVGISVDKDGMPKETYKDIIVHPGQKVLYAGPDEFSIVFKNKKTPNGKVENKSSRGVVIIQIPEDIFEKSEFVEEFRKNKTLTFDYGIRANGKELDPPMVVHPR